jgi:glycosyltransferase involved in cell wall biosynthesis
MGLGIRTALRRRLRGVPVDGEYLEGRAVTELLRRPPAALSDRRPDPQALDVGIVVPFFRHGSGGHMTIANLVRGLEARGHHCSLWIDDPGRRCRGGPAQAVADLRRWFGPFAAEVRYGLDAWRDADVAVATGWQTVARVLQLPAAARAYLVQDHEPEFFATSAQRHWAQDSYRHGLYPITAGRWLAEVMDECYGLPASSFDLGVDTELYRPSPVARRDDVVLFYARASTPRRATPLAFAALAELKRRRPGVELWLYGHPAPAGVDFPFRHLGVVEGRELAELYSTATVGLVLSMTNYSLVPQEMLACGLPCVELDSPSIVAAFGHDGPVELAPFEPHAIADALERLLDDPALRARRAQEGAAMAAARTWPAAAEQVEAGLVAAIAFARDPARRA